MPAPIIFTWNGEAFEPLTRFRKLCDHEFVVGHTYRLEPINERSQASHNHQFAWLHDAWLNLPDGDADLYPSPEHLRKRALIEAGFYDEQIVDAGTAAAAIRVASAFRSREEFSLVIVRGRLVVLRTPKSQSLRAMGKKDFQASKTAILEVVSAMLGVTPEALLGQSGSPPIIPSQGQRRRVSA